jgi:exonuclease SbcD
VKLLFYTDLHAADQTPRSWSIDYCGEILKNYAEIHALAHEHSVDYLLNGADTFDRKSGWRVSHRLVNQLIEASTFPGESHFTVVGTHDVPTGQLEKLPNQPLGVLEKAGVITVLGEPHLIDTLTLGHAGDRTVILHAVPARYDLDKDPGNYGIIYGTDKPILGGPEKRTARNTITLTMAHGMIMPPGQTHIAEFTSADDIVTEADLILYGHPHTPDGVYTNRHGTLFCGPGSISRRDSSPYNRTRTPQVALIDIQPDGVDYNSIELIPLKSATPGSVVFDNVIADEQDENEQNARLDAFVQTLKGAKLSDDQTGTETLLRELDNLPGEEGPKKLAREIIETITQ